MSLTLLTWDIELEMLHEGKSICGYLRNPIYVNTDRNSVLGNCGIKDRKCTIDLPYDFCQRCSTYLDLVAKRHKKRI